MSVQASHQPFVPQRLSQRALVVDDEASLVDLISMALRYEGWETRTAGSGVDALAAIRDFEPDVLVLDIMMPGLDGLEVLHRLREDGNHVPVLFLTARDSLQDRLTGLNAGGDDYLTKPFSLDELLARVHALVRRSTNATHSSDESVLQVDDLSVDQQTLEVRRGDQLVALTSTELELLRYLMKHQGRVVTKADIYENVWHTPFEGASNVVELNISNVRKKIETDSHQLIRTVRGVGYMIKAEHGR